MLTKSSGMGLTVSQPRRGSVIKVGLCSRGPHFQKLPFRGLVTAGLHKLHDGVDPYFQSANRGKRSVGINLKHPDGRSVLARLVSNCDVF